MIEANKQQAPKYGYGSLPLCNKCGKHYNAWTQRSKLVKMLLFWLPLKRFVCYRCNRSRHLLRSNPFSG